MDYLILFSLLGLVVFVGGFILGFWISHHIHAVTNAAVRAVTVPAGVVHVVGNAVPAAGNALNQASTSAQGAVQSAADKAASI